MLAKVGELVLPAITRSDRMHPLEQSSPDYIQSSHWTPQLRVGPLFLNAAGRGELRFAQGLTHGLLGPRVQGLGNRF
jgi:hypothetical protein